MFPYMIPIYDSHTRMWVRIWFPYMISVYDSLYDSCIWLFGIWFSYTTIRIWLIVYDYRIWWCGIWSPHMIRVIYGYPYMVDHIWSRTYDHIRNHIWLSTYGLLYMIIYKNHIWFRYMTVIYEYPNTHIRFPLGMLNK